MAKASPERFVGHNADLKLYRHSDMQKRGVTGMSKKQTMEPLSIPQIFAGSTKILENAQELIEAAELLLKNMKNAPAFALAHLAKSRPVETRAD